MPDPDYKALCADLLDWAERTSAHYVVHPNVILRARAALAQPVPVVVPVAVSDALIKAECALSDVAEGSRNAATATQRNGLSNAARKPWRSSAR
jgi:hypothetical protein